MVGARDATETCQYTLDRQACEFARHFSSVIGVRNISCSFTCARVYFLVSHTFLPSGDEVIQFQRACRILP